MNAKPLGKVVGASSHVDYLVRIYGKRDGDVVPVPEDFSFGNFVALGPISGRVIVGVISNSMLIDPEYSRYGLRLSAENELAVFAPDYLEERAVMVCVSGLGYFEVKEGKSKDAKKINESKENNEKREGKESKSDILPELSNAFAVHDVCPVCPEIGTSVFLLGEEEVKSFHTRSDNVGMGKMKVMVGYMGMLSSKNDPLSQSLAKAILRMLGGMFPEESRALEVLLKNIDYRMKLEGSHAR